MLRAFPTSNAIKIPMHKNHLLVSTANLLILSSLALAVDDRQPIKARLETRWTKDVSPENVWPEYPRPQMVRPDWVNLDGLWDYAVRPKSENQPTLWDGKILVPFAIESALSRVQKPVSPDERLWYRRTFIKPKLSADGRLLLHLGGVDWQMNNLGQRQRDRSS
jgi:hypothetical protein